MMKNPGIGMPRILILTKTILTRTPGIPVMIIPMITIQTMIITLTPGIPAMIIRTMILQTMSAVIQIDARFVTTAWSAEIIRVPIVVMTGAGAVSAVVSIAATFARPAAVA